MRAARALRGWHIEGARDLSEFEGFSLASIFRFDLTLGLADLFRQAALGRAPKYGGFIEDDGGAQKFSPLPDFSLSWRRTDWRARAFRLFCAAARSKHERSVLAVALGANRSLWRYWAEHHKELGFGLDFMLSRPPDSSSAIKAVLRGARMFDPAPEPLSAAQKERLSRIKDDVQRLSQSPTWRELFNYRGLDFSEEFSRQMLLPFLSRLEGMAVKCLAFEREFVAKMPDLLLIPEDASSDARLLAACARKHGVPVWLQEHGFPSVGYRVEDHLGNSDLDADKILAWGETDLRNYRELGVPETHMDVLGSPVFDAFLPAAPRHPLTSVRGASFVLLGQLRIWGATLYYDGGEEKQFLEVAGLLRRLGAARILYKLHPGLAKLDYFRGLEKKLPPGCPIEYFKDQTFREVLSQADAAIGPVSTAVIETMLCGKDYFIMHNDPYESAPPLTPDQPYVARSIESLERNLKEGRPAPRDKVLGGFCGIGGSEQPLHFTRRLLERLSQSLQSPA